MIPAMLLPALIIFGSTFGCLYFLAVLLKDAGPSVPSKWRD